jgi:hypothetical protein
LGLEERHRLIERVESNLVGRRWEMSAVGGLLDRAVDGHGAVVGVVGPPGIGKSGRYTVSDAGVIDHLPDVSLFPNWEHTVVPRRATIANDRLTLELVEPLVIDGRQLGGRLTWERVEVFEARTKPLGATGSSELHTAATEGER